MFALHVTRFLQNRFRLLILIGAIILMVIGSPLGVGQGPNGRIPQCELSLNISVESMDNSINSPTSNTIYFKRGDPVNLTFELMNKVKKDHYDSIKIEYNISDLYMFPPESIGTNYRYPNKCDSGGFFCISFNRKNATNKDYFEVNNKGCLSLYCEEVYYSEKIYFNISTRIANNSRLTGEHEIADLRIDHISPIPNKCSLVNQDKNFNITNKNKMNINGLLPPFVNNIYIYYIGLAIILIIIIFTFIPYIIAIKRTDKKLWKLLTYFLLLIILAVIALSYLREVIMGVFIGLLIELIMLKFKSQFKKFIDDSG